MSPLGPLLLLALSSAWAQSPAELCRNGEGQKSCGQCIKQHPDCAWCSDPKFTGNLRCDVVSDHKGCAQDKVFQPKSETSYLRDQQIGTQKQDRVTTVQLQPQQVKITMKPGETVSFPLSYLHLANEARNVYALNSETASNGLQVQYSVNCKGRLMDGPQCQGVTKSETIVFNVSLTLQECKTTGDAVVSIGIGGLRDVVAVYVTPVCGCECEKLNNQVQRASECEGFGALVCGACVCDKGRGGDTCECDLATSGASNAAELTDQCTQSSDEPPCSGKGKCVCGQCDCDADYISGQFCECDDTSCPVSNGILCGGHGLCKCGTCNCESGWNGNSCDCTTDTADCTAGDGSVCGGRGSCICGACECETGASGETCDEGMDEAEETAEEAEPEPSVNEETEEEVAENETEEGNEAEPEAEPENSAGTDAYDDDSEAEPTTSGSVSTFVHSIVFLPLLALWLRP